MEERGWFLDSNKGLVHESQVGDFVGETKPIERSPRLSGTRTARTGMTKTFRPPLRRIGGNPNGTWESIKTWWTGLKPEYRYGIVAAPFLVGIIAAAAGKKEKTLVEKI